MSEQSGSTVFRAEFLDKDLMEFVECEQHYKTIDSKKLLGELGFLFRRDVEAIPFGFTGRRYYAFLSALIDRAASSREFSDRERAELVRIIIDVRDYARNRTAESSRADFDAAFASQLDGVATHGLFPKVAELINTGARDYSETFEESIVGRVLERRGGAGHGI